jgi:hypothetical protein
VSAYQHSAEDVKNEYGETYIAPLYNYLIENGKLVLPYRIDKSSIHVLGTPEDLKKFDPSFSIDTQ